MRSNVLPLHRRMIRAVCEHNILKLSLDVWVRAVCLIQLIAGARWHMSLAHANDDSADTEALLADWLFSVFSTLLLC